MAGMSRIGGCLYPRGRKARGLVVDAEGVTLGPDCTLVRWTPAGYRGARRDDVAWLLHYVFDGDGDPERLATALAAIAAALDAGDLEQARSIGRGLAVGMLDDRHLHRLALAATAIRIGDGLQEGEPSPYRPPPGPSVLRSCASGGG